MESDRRIASYNKLPPGHYRFLVQGATAEGRWQNSTPLELTIQPPWWQTVPFRVAILVLCIGLIWSIYVVRLRQISRQLEIRLDERVSERTRIARELHDSLLQGFQGVIFLFQRARNFLPELPREAAGALDVALNQADETIIQAREAVTDLRTLVPDEISIEASVRQIVDSTTEVQLTIPASKAYTRSERVRYRTNRRLTE